MTDRTELSRRRRRRNGHVDPDAGPAIRRSDSSGGARDSPRSPSRRSRSASGRTRPSFPSSTACSFRPIPLPHGDRLAFFTRDGDVSVPDGVDWRARQQELRVDHALPSPVGLRLDGQGRARAPPRMPSPTGTSSAFSACAPRPAGSTARRTTVRELRASRSSRTASGDGASAADPRVVGSHLTLSDHPVTVIGVAPPEADFLQDGVELWVPLAAETPWALDERGTNNFDAIGRMCAAVIVRTASAEIVAITTDLSKRLSEDERAQDRPAAPAQGLPRPVGAAAPPRAAGGGRARPAAGEREPREPAARARLDARSPRSACGSRSARAAAGSSGS